MKKLGTAAVVAVVALAAMLVAGSALGSTAAKKKPAPKAKKIAFVASYAGNATVQVADSVAKIAATGSGTGSLIGAGKVTGNGTGNTAGNPACVPFTGPGTMTGAKGAISFTVLSGSSGCGDEQGESFTISGKAKVTKATGALAKAKGTLRVTGTYDHTAGTFTVKFSGTLVK